MFHSYVKLPEGTFALGDFDVKELRDAAMHREPRQPVMFGLRCRKLKGWTSRKAIRPREVMIKQKTELTDLKLVGGLEHDTYFPVYWE